MNEEELDKLNIQEILEGAPDPNNILALLAPQEIDILAELIHSSFRQGFSVISSRKVSAPDQQVQIVSENIIQQLREISNDLSIKDLEKKLEVKTIVESILGNK